MKTIPTVEGKMYCVSATTECTITSQSGTVLGTAFPGTPFWFQAQKGETTTISDDAAEYSASRFNLAPIAFGGGGKPGWYDVLRSELAELLGAGNFSLTYAWVEDKFTLTLALPLEITDDQMAQVRVLLGSIPPRNLATEIDPFPIDCTRIEYLESTGSQWMITDFVPNNESGVMARYINNSGNSVNPISTAETINGTKYGVSVATMRSVSTTNVLWGSLYNPAQYNPSNTAIVNGKTNYLNSRNVIWKDLEANYQILRPIGGAYGYTSPLSYSPTVPFHFGKDLWYMNKVNFRGKLLEAKFSRGEQDACIFIPALDDAGVPCMYDLLARKACYNSGSGQFIAGVETMEQLDAVLRGLPDYTGQDGGELHLRLADALYESAVASGIIEATATAKNWQIAYDPTTEIAA